MKVLHYWLGIVVAFCGCNSHNSLDSSREVVAKVNDKTIYIGDLDNQLTQIIYDELNRIHSARTRLLSIMVDEELLRQEASKQGLTVEQLLEEFCSSQEKQGTKATMLNKFSMTNEILDLRSDLQRVDIKSAIGQSNFESGYRKQMRMLLVDSLRKNSNIETFLEPPVRPRVDISGLTIARDRPTDKSVPTLTLITDPECSSCKEFFPLIDSIYKEYAGNVNFEIIPNSGYVSIGSLALLAASEQGYAWNYYRLLNTETLDCRDTSSFERLAVKAGYNIPAFKHSIRSEKFHEGMLKNNVQLHSHGLNKVPTVVINGKIIEDLISCSIIRKALEDEFQLMMR